MVISVFNKSADKSTWKQNISLAERENLMNTN